MAMDPAVKPTLQQVADYIPERTRPYGQVGDNAELLGTFTETTTTPTSTQVLRLIDAAAAWVDARVPAIPGELEALARSAVAMRTAGLIEQAFPRRDAEINTADALFVRAEEALAQLAASTEALTGASSDPADALLPIGSFPEAPTWGDWNL